MVCRSWSWEKHRIINHKSRSDDILLQNKHFVRRKGVPCTCMCIRERMKRGYLTVRRCKVSLLTILCIGTAFLKMGQSLRPSMHCQNFHKVLVGRNEVLFCQQALTSCHKEHGSALKMLFLVKRKTEAIVFPRPSCGEPTTLRTTSIITKLYTRKILQLNQDSLLYTRILSSSVYSKVWSPSSQS